MISLKEFLRKRVMDQIVGGGVVVSEVNPKWVFFISIDVRNKRIVFFVI